MGGVGGQENVEGRGILDLLRQLRGGGEAEGGMNASLGFEFRPGGLEHRGEIGRRRDRKSGVLRGFPAATARSKTIQATRAWKSGADALVRARPPGRAIETREQPDQGVRRGPGGPPHLRVCRVYMLLSWIQDNGLRWPGARTAVHWKRQCPGSKTSWGRLRQKRGIPAARLAKAAGVTRQTIYAMEAGSYIPNTAVALRLAKALDATVEDLFALPRETPAVEARTEQAHLLTGAANTDPAPAAGSAGGAGARGQAPAGLGALAHAVVFPGQRRGDQHQAARRAKPACRSSTPRRISATGF